MSARRYLAPYTSWLIPLAYSVSALLGGFTFPRLEEHLFPRLTVGMSVPSAMAIYSSIASGMIALTGIVFSLTFLMVQFSATAYSPRLVLWKSRDPVLAHALGTFTATFLYALSALAWIDRNTAKVPFFSALVVALLLLASISMFVSLTQRISALQIERMLQYVGQQGRDAIKNLYPRLDSVAITPAEENTRSGLALQTLFHRGEPGAIQAVRVQKLIELASRWEVIIELEAAVGDTINEFTPLLRVYGATQPIDEESLWATIAIGTDRTFEQDPKYALRLLVDIAIRALSPALNDPTTAVQSLNQIEDLLFRLGFSKLDIGNFRDADGKLRLMIPVPAWADFLRLALEEIRYYGASSVQVLRRLNALIDNLISILPEKRRPELFSVRERVRGTISRSFQGRAEHMDASMADSQGLGIPRKTDAA